MSKKGLIIFDGYGVVMSCGFPDTCRVLARRFHIPYEKLFRILYVKYFNQAAERKITQAQAWQKAIDELQLPLSSRELQAIHFNLLRINPTMLAFVKKVGRDYTTLLLSKNTRTQFSKTKKKMPEVWRSFDAVINTWELGLPKASKKIILLIAKRFNVQPRDMVFIDDQQNNLDEAKSMGVKTILYKNNRQAMAAIGKFLK